MSLAPHGFVLWLDDDGDRQGIRDVAAEIDALSGFVAELDGRLGGVGVGGLSGAVDAYRKIKSVLDGVTVADLERLASRVEALRSRLAQVERQLATVRELKALFDATAEPR